MKTYLYVDFYCILNFIMNLFLIMATAMIRQKRYNFLRFLFQSGIHAFLSAIFTYFLWENVILQIVCAILQMADIVFWAYEREGATVWAADFACFLFLAFFTGGFIGVVRDIACRNMPEGKRLSMWLVFSAVMLLSCLFYLLRRECILLGQERKNIRTVRVAHRGREATIRALYDTGNQLISPYTGESVIIVSKELSDALGLPDGQNPVLIPYHSIGGGGLLEAYRLECIQMKGGCRNEILAAVSEELNGSRKIQMILNIT